MPKMTSGFRKFWMRYESGDKGQREYCLECLKGDDLYALWLINNHLSIIKPVGQCQHK